MVLIPSFSIARDKNRSFKTNKSSIVKLSTFKNAMIMRYRIKVRHIYTWTKFTLMDTVVYSTAIPLPFTPCFFLYPAFAWGGGYTQPYGMGHY